MSKLPSYKKQMRAGFCAFSPEFKERVKEIRSKLGVPQGGFPKEVRTVPGPPQEGFPKEIKFYPAEATRWYVEQVQKAIGKLQRDLPPYYWHFPKEFAELIENFAYSRQPCRPGFHPEIPLDCYAMDLVHEFGLPEYVVNEVKANILVEESCGFGTTSALQLILLPMEENEEPKFLALVAGIDSSTTEKEWLDVWREIKKQMRWKGIKTAPTKRDEEKNEIRDLTWWKWSKKGLSAREITDRWQERHPEQYENKELGEDTVRAAVKKMEKIMRPIPQNES